MLDFFRAASLQEGSGDDIGRALMCGDEDEESTRSGRKDVFQLRQ